LISYTCESSTVTEDKVLCDAWMMISQDLVCSTEQKGGTCWRRVGKNYHDRRKFKPYNIESSQNGIFLQKIWSFIQAECSKFCGANEHVLACPKSNIGYVDIVNPLAYASQANVSNICDYIYWIVIYMYRCFKLWSTSRTSMRTICSH
jgi:hypothetical protein